MIIKHIDIERQSLKEELSKLEIKLQSLSDEKNEYLRDIEDFNLQYNLYLGELIENILRLKKDILYKKNSHKKDISSSENYDEIKDTISQVKSALYELEKSLKTLDKNDLKYTETLKLYNQLKEELQNLTNQKDEIEEQIYSFKDSEDYDFEYTSAKHAYEEYYYEYTNIKEDIENNITLNDQEKLEIKSLWKKACKLCHPDIMADDLKEKAHEVMQALNEAYSIKDIEKIKLILQDLENGIAFQTQSDSLNNLELLNAKILEYKEQIQSIESEIQNIKSSATFKIISQENNWNNHFHRIKQNLKEEKEKLENQLFLLIKNEKNKFDLYIFSNNLMQIKNKREFENYLESYFFEIENFFDLQDIEDIRELEFDLEKIVRDLKFSQLIGQNNSNIINAFLILLAQQFEKIKHTNLMILILAFLPACGIKKRIEASLLYLSQENLPEAFFENFNRIVFLLASSAEDDENNIIAANILFHFYTTAYNFFIQQSDQDSLNLFNQLFILNQSKYSQFVENQSFVREILDHANIETKKHTFNNQFLLEYKALSHIYDILDESIIFKEDSEYGQTLYALTDPTFKDIKKIASNYINSIGNPNELFYQLNRGMKIIDNEKLLFKYLQSFGAKHKLKLYDAFEKIIHKLEKEQFNIIDWGCGQAFATMMLLDFARERGVVLDISHITLIEPSKLALSRGLLHIDVLKQKEYSLKGINNDLDCIKGEDITFENEYKTLHLFSNILDVESFRLDRDFLQKIAGTIVSDNLFVCVSPNINDKRNSRIDLFYKYFDENMSTSLISARDTDIQNVKRYEKIFEVAFTKKQEVVEAREEFREYHLDIYAKLNQYALIMAPILDVARVKESLEQDSDYIIFKIRKVTEVLTSKIYSKYQDNEEKVSQNDKIRYLSYEKKVLSRKAQSYLHTIRTIGNISVHEHIDNPSKMLKDDAYFLLTALVLLIEDFLEVGLIIKE